MGFWTALERRDVCSNREEFRYLNILLIHICGCTTSLDLSVQSIRKTHLKNSDGTMVVIGNLEFKLSAYGRSRWIRVSLPPRVISVPSTLDERHREDIS